MPSRRLRYMEEPLLTQLAQVNQHIALGLSHIGRQRDIMHNFDRSGHDTALAKRTLDMLIETQRKHVERRDKLLGMLT